MSSVVATESTAEVARTRAAALPSWPVLALIWGFPVFWALGATVIAGVLLTGVMVAYLVHHRAAIVPPGVLALGAFCLWVVPCAVMIDAAPRLMGYVYRGSILLIVATAFLYTVSARTHVTRAKVVHALTFLWFVTIAGGLLGMAFPEVRLSTPIGMLLPGSLSENSYVRDLFFPPFAEVQQPYGSPDVFVRPSAPYPYANSWGVAFVLLTPVAVACFLMTARRWLRVVIVGGLVVAIAPAMATSNRGMFAGLALAALYVVARLAVRNRAAPVITIAVLGAAGTVALIANGLLTQLAARQEYGRSTDTRFSVYQETWERTLQSPLLGYGTPRPSTVGEISIGTQGYVWMLMFSYGFVGLVLFLTFLWGTTLRTWRAVGDVDLVLHSVLVVASLVIAFYGLDVMQLLTIMLVAAVLVRRRYGLDLPASGG